MNTDTVLVACLLVVGFALISGPIKASPITPAMIFVIVGVLVGPDVLGIFDLRVGQSGFKGFAEAALTLLLLLQPRGSTSGRWPRTTCRVGWSLSVCR